MGKKYRITVIAAGARSNNYLRMLKQYHANDVELLGITDPLEDRVNKTMAEFGIPKKFPDYKTAISETKPDIVIVGTPAYFHCDIASFAMDNGANVLTEKPFDLSLDKAFKLREKQKQTGKSLAIGLQYRNNLRNRAIKQMMDKRLIGNNVIMSFYDIREIRPKPAMHDAQFGNGGVFCDMACHYFDLMRWFYKCNPKSVSSVWKVLSTDAPFLSGIETKAPDYAIITVEYESGDMGMIIINWVFPREITQSLNMSSIIGSMGYVLPNFKAPWEERKIPSELQIMANGKESSVKHLPEDEQDCVCAELAVYDHLIAEIEGRGKVQAGIEEGIISLSTSLAAIKSGAIGRTVTVKEIQEIKPTVLECMS